MDGFPPRAARTNSRGGILVATSQLSPYYDSPSGLTVAAHAAFVALREMGTARLKHAESKTSQPRIDRHQLSPPARACLGPAGLLHDRDHQRVQLSMHLLPAKRSRASLRQRAGNHVSRGLQAHHRQPPVMLRCADRLAAPRWRAAAEQAPRGVHQPSDGAGDLRHGVLELLPSDRRAGPAADRCWAPDGRHRLLRGCGPVRAAAGQGSVGRDADRHSAISPGGRGRPDGFPVCHQGHGDARPSPRRGQGPDGADAGAVLVMAVYFHNALGESLVNLSGPAAMAAKETTYTLCHQPWVNFTVDFAGRVVGCCRDLRSEYVLGNLLEQPADEIWNGPRMMTLRSALVDKQPQDIGICKACDVPWQGSYSGRTPLEKVRNFFFAGAWRRKLAPGRAGGLHRYTLAGL